MDKLLHFLVGAAISGQLVAYGVPITIAFAVGCTAAIAKEAYDSYGNGKVEFLDGLATILGSALVLPLLFWS